MAGAIVNLEGGRPEFTRAGTRSHLETDAHGKFRVSGLSSGAFRLVIGRPGFATEVREVHEDRLDEDLDLRIVLTPEARVKGRVLDGSGRPMPGVVVQVLLPGTVLMPGLIETSDAEGRFELFSLKPGPARFQLTHLADESSTRMHEDVVLLPGSQELEFRWHGAAPVGRGGGVTDPPMGDSRFP